MEVLQIFQISLSDAVKNFTTAEGGAAVWKDIEGIDNEGKLPSVSVVITSWSVKRCTCENAAWSMGV